MLERFLVVAQQHEHLADHAMRPRLFHSLRQRRINAGLLAIMLQRIFVFLILLVPTAEIVTGDGQLRLIVFKLSSPLLSDQLCKK